MDSQGKERENKGKSECYQTHKVRDKKIKIKGDKMIETEKKMKYTCRQKVNSYIEMHVEAKNSEQAKKLARQTSKNMSNAEYNKQVIANSRADLNVSKCSEEG